MISVLPASTSTSPAFRAIALLALATTALPGAALAQSFPTRPITMIVPFFVSWLFTRATLLTGRTPAILIGFILSVGR